MLPLIEPYFRSSAPKYNLLILAWEIAAAHIMQGSKVTYKSQLISLLVFNILQASLITFISAWAVGSKFL